MKFAYDGFDAQGERQTGLLEAANKVDALRELQRKAITPIDLKADEGKKAPGLFTPRLTRQHITQALHELTRLIESEVSIAESIEAMTDAGHHERIATAIPETRLNASFQPTAASAFQVASKDFTPAGVIKRDGSSQQVDLVLNPQSVYDNFVRITNKSGIAGKFVIEVINDAGESKSISLSEVAGQNSDIINAGASTSQINAKDVYRAAEAKGLTLSAASKLRFVVTGEVQSTQYEYARNVEGTIATGDGTVSTTATTVVNTNDGISVQSYTVARDGNSFATF
ncbi:hypothetical protein [Stutzerimonas kunmingensis]|uniref:hypothetical protein n=1 Tax=Stutzerimonas kunmingensis TaxID=1211807 RepID=UPI0028A0F33B|nr:hypothetical protein [Stutzerimonas kunmingensis]